MTTENQPRILVLLSTYNGEKYLALQLESLKEQKNVDLHVLVRDDGSKDTTLDILHTYRSRMNLEIIAAENMGSTRSFMQLLRDCPNDFDYYAFCDQDDYWEEDKLSIAVEKLQSVSPDRPALYYSGQTLVDKDMNVIHEHILDTKRNVLANCIFNQVAGCTSVFNRELLLRMRAIKETERMPGFHDSCLYKVCALSGGSIICDGKGHIQYRQHGSNVVGLDYSIPGKIAKFKKYLKPSELLADLEYIFNGSAAVMENAEWKFLQMIVEANHSAAAKILLLASQHRLRFHNMVLRGIFWYKVIFSKL